MDKTQTQYIEPVMFMCESKGSPVSTGHRMRAKEFDALNGPRSFRCGACGAIHTWTKETAWRGQRSPQVA